jgi:hypothetical protein
VLLTTSKRTSYARCRAQLFEEPDGFKFRLSWHDEATRLPDAEATRAVSAAYHLRSPFMPTNSFGHLMRDNYEPIVNIELKLGVNPKDFTWVMVPSQHFSLHQRVSRRIPPSMTLSTHYTQWFMDKQIVMWRTVFPDAGAPFNPEGRPMPCTTATTGLRRDLCMAQAYVCSSADDKPGQRRCHSMLLL